MAEKAKEEIYRETIASQRAKRERFQSESKEVGNERWVGEYFVFYFFLTIYGPTSFFQLMTVLWLEVWRAKTSWGQNVYAYEFENVCAYKFWNVCDYFNDWHSLTLQLPKYAYHFPLCIYVPFSYNFYKPCTVWFENVPTLPFILGPMAWRRNCLHCQSCERKEWQRRRRRRSSTGVSCSRRRWPRGPESWRSSVSPLSLCHPQSLGGRNPLWKCGQHRAKAFDLEPCPNNLILCMAWNFMYDIKNNEYETQPFVANTWSCKTFLILWPLFWSFLKKGVLNKHTSCFENLFEPYWVSFYFHRK